MTSTTFATSSYRQIAATGATRIGLLIVVLDSIAEDLRLAGIAAARQDIAARCKASNHALLLLGHLESWAAESDERELKASLLQFYSYLRASILALQVVQDERSFQEVAQHVTNLRVTWRAKETELRKTQTIVPPALSYIEAEPSQTRWSG